MQLKEKKKIVELILACELNIFAFVVFCCDSILGNIRVCFRQV